MSEFYSLPDTVADCDQVFVLHLNTDKMLPNYVLSTMFTSKIANC